MNGAMFTRLFEYNQWANHNLWARVMELTEAQFTGPSDYSIGSVHAQVVHMLGADELWLRRLQGVSLRSLPEPSDFPTRPAIRAAWDAIEGEMLAHVRGLTEADLLKTLDYWSLTGETQRQTPVWEALLHIVNHATDHRAQTLAQIHRVGGRTDAQDMIYYVWEH